MVVTAILELKDLTIFSIEELAGSLLSHEARMNLDVGTLEHAFQSKIFMDRGRCREFCGRRGIVQGWSQSKDKSGWTKDMAKQSLSSSQYHSQRWTDK